MAAAGAQLFGLLVPFGDEERLLAHVRVAAQSEVFFVLECNRFERVTRVPASSDLRSSRWRIGDGHCGAYNIIGIDGGAASADDLQARAPGAFAKQMVREDVQMTRGFQAAPGRLESLMAEAAHIGCAHDEPASRLKESPAFVQTRN